MMLLQATATPQSYLQSQFVVLLLTGIALAAAVVFYNMLPRSSRGGRRGRRRSSSSASLSGVMLPGAVDDPLGSGPTTPSRWPYLVAAGVVLYLLLIALLRPGFLQGLSPQPEAAPPRPAGRSPFDDPEVRRQVIDVIKTQKSGSPAAPADAGAPAAPVPVLPPQVQPPAR